MPEAPKKQRKVTSVKVATPVQCGPRAGAHVLHTQDGYGLSVDIENQCVIVNRVHSGVTDEMHETIVPFSNVVSIHYVVA